MCHASELVLGWEPSPTNQNVTAYLVTAKTNGTTQSHVWAKLWVDQFVGTNETRRLPSCLVVSNIHPEHVYWFTVQAVALSGATSDPAGPILYFQTTNETQVAMTTVYSNGVMHCEAPVESGLTYWLKSSHGTPAGSFDTCCGNFTTNYSRLHWNQLFTGDLLGVSPVTGRVRFQIQPDPQRSAQYFKLYRGHTPPALTNATHNHTVNYEQ